MQANQQVTFLSDGADTVRDLQLYLNPNAEHILDWFHITMRLTVMLQTAKGLGVKGSESQENTLKKLERIKWFLWHENVFRALETVDDLFMDFDTENSTAKEKTLLKKVEEFWCKITYDGGPDSHKQFFLSLSRTQRGQNLYKVEFDCVHLN